MGEDLVHRERMLTRSGLSDVADREHHDIDFARIGLLHNFAQMIEAVWISHRHQHIARPYVDGFDGKILARVQPELLLVLTVERPVPAVVFLGEYERNEEGG